MKVLVAGSTGFIGTEVCSQLRDQGHVVMRLVRGAPRMIGQYHWSPEELTVPDEAIASADAVINLAGVSTGRIPWTPGYKRKILYSRVRGTQAIAEAIARSDNPPSVFLNGSAVGYYGDQPGVTLTEASPKGRGFLSDVVEAWEQAAQLTPSSTRLVMFRTGLVVGRGGAFTPLIPLTKLGLGARFGTGRQVWPWVSLHDEAAAIVHLLTSSLSGVVNIAGPTAATAGEVTATLARGLERWHPFVVPTFALKMLGDAGKDLLLTSEYVVSQKLIADGFTFRDTTIEQAISRMIVQTAPER
ncbi:TIGR01777 family oxidoreductase [soil metagenome]